MKTITDQVADIEAFIAERITDDVATIAGEDLAELFDRFAELKSLDDDMVAIPQYDISRMALPKANEFEKPK